MYGFRRTLQAATIMGLSVWTGQAAANSITYTDADKVVLRDFIATVNIVTAEVDEITVLIENGAETPAPLKVREVNGHIEVFSDNEPDANTFWKRVNWYNNGDKAFTKFLRDYPVVEVTIPAGTDIEIEDIAANLVADDTQGAFDILSTIYLRGAVGDVQSSNIHITGAGEMTFGSVAQTLEAKIKGSGSLSFENVAEASLSIAGSGDIEIDQINGPLSADIRGSGDIDIGDVEGDTIFKIAGSGDILAGAVDGGTDISIRGSGDISIEEINGPSAVSIAGNGDVVIAGGRAEDFTVSIRGSGDLNFGGVATNPTISLNGSGDVFIKDYEGKVKTNGSGDITIGDIRIDN